jgi:processive 1,2-diacylglycerol beta-glucosyltransferase
MEGRDILVEPKPAIRPDGGAARAVIITASVGSGHNAVTGAILASLAERCPGVEMERLDSMSFAPRFFRAYYAGGFALGMSRLPRLFGMGYRLTNRPQTLGRGLLEGLRLAEERWCLTDLSRRLLEIRPSLVVNTHFLAAPLVTWLNEHAGLGARHFVVVTDREVHRMWYSRGVDRWFVPSPRSAETFGRWGIAAEKLTVSGIPVHPKWTAPVDTDKVLAEWSLPRDMKIVLLSGGTEFTCGPIARIARRIVSDCPNAHVAVLAGRNKKLLAQLARLPECPARLRGIPFTDRLHELASVASVMVTKPGGVTTAECLAKALPMVLLKPVPGHEGGNARQLADAGAAVIATSWRDVARKVGGLLSDEGRLASLAAAAARLHLPGAQTVAEAVCREMRPR